MAVHAVEGIAVNICGVFDIKKDVTRNDEKCQPNSDKVDFTQNVVVEEAICCPVRYYSPRPATPQAQIPA